MPSVPPFSRSEKIEDYAAKCKPVVWREERFRAADGVELAVAVGEIYPSSAATDADADALRKEDRVGDSDGPGGSKEKEATKRRKRVVIIYFQGNGASTPPRLPTLSSVLRALHTTSSTSSLATQYTILAPSYRGYWHSRGRATESGIKLDAHAAILHAFTAYPSTENEEVRYILWGQSLGAAVALECAASLTSTPTTPHSTTTPSTTTPRTTSPSTKALRGMEISGLILETPFLSIASMLLELYPQKWLPYRYLSPFLWNHWDSLSAIERLASQHSSSPSSPSSYPSPTQGPKILILQAGADELVPSTHAETLEEKAKELGMDVKRVSVRGALHNDVSGKVVGRREIVGFVREAEGAGEGGKDER